MRYLFVMGILLTLLGCQQQNDSSTKQQTAPIAKEALIWQQAEVVRVPHLVSEYGLITNKGKELFPTNLPDKFKRAGLKVNVLGKNQPIQSADKKWGISFHIQQINELKP